MNVRFCISYDIKIASKSHFWVKAKICHQVCDVVIDVITYFNDAISDVMIACDKTI